MTSRVVVTGLGIVCPLGVGVNNVWSNLIKGGCGISSVKDKKSYEGVPCKIAAYVQENELRLDERFSKSEMRQLSRSTLFALLAADEALTDSNWKPSNATDQRETGVAVGMGMPDLADIVENGALLSSKGFRALSPYFITRILINMPAGNVSIRYGLKGPNHAVSTACTTGVHAIGDGFNFIKRGAAKVMLCGGTEAVISPFSIASFAKLRALCTKFNDNPLKASRPFDNERCGFVMGEGCGLLVLEELKHALARNAKIYGEILGYGLSGDAHHITAPSGDGHGALDCMKAAINDANVELNEIGHINAHATSTPLGDLAEISAVKELFGHHAKNIAITSRKGATGHLLGSAGSIEALFALLACFNKLIPPTINLENSLDPQMNISNKAQDWETRNKRIAITNSFGFGGTNASLLISEFL